MHCLFEKQSINSQTRLLAGIMGRPRLAPTDNFFVSINYNTF